MIQFPIMNRWSGAVQFTAEIECAEDTPRSIKVGLAVKWAIKSAANLHGANLRDANLRAANLSDAKNDFWDVLLRAQPEVPALLAALRAGRINGSTYTGECACLAGTIAKARGVPYCDLGFANSERPIERWFLGIREGDTPEASPIAKITEEWIGEFQQLVGARVS